MEGDERPQWPWKVAALVNGRIRGREILFRFVGEPTETKLSVYTLSLYLFLQPQVHGPEPLSNTSTVIRLCCLICFEWQCSVRLWVFILTTKCITMNIQGHQIISNNSGHPDSPSGLVSDLSSLVLDERNFWPANETAVILSIALFFLLIGKCKHANTKS